jgi:chemotaxis protein methyltransferase CheR
VSASLDLPTGTAARFRHVVFADSHRPARAFDLGRIHERTPRDPFMGAGTVDGDGLLFWLLERTGIEPTCYRLETLRRRLPSVLRVLRASTPVDARRVLERDRSLVATALSAAVIGVTSFFRDAPVFEVLESQILPELLARPTLRVWSAGCANGAELYSVAMLLADARALGRASLLGTDCRAHAVLAARQGFFDAYELKDVPDERRLRHFEEEPPRLRLASEIRAATAWRFGNLLAYAEPGPWDLILCRNVAIYLQPSAVVTLWKHLADELRPGGYLIVGKAERPGAVCGLESVGPCVYRRRAL